MELPNRKYINFTNVGSIKTIFKDFQHSRQLAYNCPSLNINLVIALTISVTSASTERSFPKLELIKTKLKTTTTEKGLEGMVIS